MSTLPAEIQEHYYSLEKATTDEGAKAIIQEFFKEYTPEQVEREL
jgi:hypothetical protein